MLKTPLHNLPWLKVLGDSHLGRRFLEGVPVHRRGERERGMLNHFSRALVQDVQSTDVVVQTGDIFDGLNVDTTTVLETYWALRKAHEATGATYVVLRGNHDASRDVNRKSSFDLLAAIFSNHPGVKILQDPTWMEKHGRSLGFMPWHPFLSAKELAAQLADLGQAFSAVFTHCDLDSFGGSDFNLMPYEELSKITAAVVNGHIHEAEERDVNDTRFIMVGSMEPYSHGEDSQGQFYVTLTLEEFFKTDPATLINKNVRFLLEEGENVPDEVPDCLSITFKRVKVRENSDEPNDSEVVLADFSLSNIISDCLKRSGVSATILTSVLTKYEESKNAD